MRDGSRRVDDAVVSAHVACMVADAAMSLVKKRKWPMEHPLSLEEKFVVLNALYEEARLFGHFSQDDLLLGLEEDVRLAAKLNANISNPSR